MAAERILPELLPHDSKQSVETFSLPQDSCSETFLCVKADSAWQHLILRQTARCDVGMNTVDLTDRNDHIAPPLTIQIPGSMNHHSIGQFNPHAAVKIDATALGKTGSRRIISQRDRHKPGRSLL